MAENYKFVNYAGAEMAELFDKVADLDVATQSKAGLMSTTDKTKLDELPAGAQVNVLEGVQLAGTDLSISEKKVNIPVDNAPTEGSSALIRSGAVATALANAVRLEEYDISDTEMLAVNLQNKILLVSVSDNSISTAVYLLCGTDDSTNTIVKRIHGMIDGDEPLEFYAGTSGSNNYIAPSSPTNKIMLAWLNGSSEVEVVDRELGDTERLFFSVGADKDLEAVVGNLATFDENGNPVDSGISSEKFSELEGKITDLSQSAGIAEGIADSTSAGTAQEIVYRQSGGDGVNYMKRIKGKSLVWNQLCPFTSTPTITNATWSNNTLLATARNGQVYWEAPIGSIIEEHKYIQIVTLKTTAAAGQIRVFSLGESINIYNVAASGSYQVLAGIANARQLLRAIAVRDIRESDWDAIEVAGVMLIDLTLMFGSGNEPSTVDEFRALFPLPYYDYNEGTIISNDAESLETVGFNLWDEEWEVGYMDNSGNPIAGNQTIRSKNYIPIIGGRSYYISVPNTWLQCYAYDADKNFLAVWGSDGVNPKGLPNNAGYIKFRSSAAYGTTYNHDICINLSNTAKNGTYEPYWKRTLDLGLNDFKVKDGDNIITVNGLKSAGSVYDEISNGKYIKRIETRAYQSGDESDSAVTTDGTNTNYALATPIEYELAEPIPNAILSDEDGTEKAVFPTHEDGTPSAPLCIDSNYSISVAKLVKAIKSLNE